jgi:DNA phosphorothioation-dependent restriction protein DptG
LFLTHGTTTDNQKVDLFELYLKSDSPAEEWFNDAATPKKTWADLEKEFKIRFPNTKKATKTAVGARIGDDKDNNGGAGKDGEA